MKRSLASIALGMSVVMMLTGMAFAKPAPAPVSTGQPNLDCSNGQTPGNAATAPGSAFNEGGVAAGKYAGEQSQNTVNSHTFSQYDCGCFPGTKH